MADRIRTLTGMSQGDYEEAYRAATVVSEPGNFPPNIPRALNVCMDLVESAVLIGKSAEAQAHVDAVQRLNIGAYHPVWRCW